MINPLRPIWAALRDVFDEFLLLMGCNMIWCLLSLPLLWVAYVLISAGATLPAAVVAMAGVLPAGPATAAMAYVANRVSEGRATRVGEYLGAMRTYARRGWTLLGIWMLGFLIILVDIGFYMGVGNLLGAIILGLWVYLLAVWLALLIYIFPLMALQEEFSLRGVARSAGLMVVGRPIFTLVNLALMLAVIFGSLIVVVPIFVITVSLLNVWSVRAARALIDDARRRREGAEATEATPVEEKGRKGQVRPK
ncbi:hypothetical protein K2Z83_18835 [Oscillochloris sp. ZM17-4]|uniref:hypothetical protein n=1 Tax=Oscillochloris sp. ZM17-4 TaxID=2866714 RepID=UPI001C7368DC|nr:hypothetical protein [Oscillochloris sp. ZM17-4]MBX0329731.1 hypothetical protein [Oscillochloris sp. ZM17-4]